MRISLELELEDNPEQLVDALKSIATRSGNIISVIHHRDKMTQKNTIPVKIILDIDKDRLDSLLSDLNKSEISVTRFGEERLRESILVILIGHIVYSDIRDTIDSIDKTGFAEVVDISLAMPGIPEKSSAAFTIKASDEEKLDQAVSILKGVAVEKDLMVLTPL